jgi:SAM-dependent methyltransferase
VKDQVVYRHRGFCPICEEEVTFLATSRWHRDHLWCPRCPGGSIPRERALMAVLSAKRPGWRSLRIHESSPGNRGASAKIARECARYTATHFFPGGKPGEVTNGFRNENLEAQTFDDASFDVVLSLDVLEHVNRPDRVCQEVNRTLASGGLHIFTTPTYKSKPQTERRAQYLPDGRVEHLFEPEYHGNPIDEAGSLVTFHFGYDLPELIGGWCGMDVEVTRWQSPSIGVVGEFTEVYCCAKR